jgi:hypothetical protein
MMVDVSINQWAGIVIYLLAITGISFLGAKLSSVVAGQTIVLALPYLDNGPPKLSLMGRRRVEAMQAVQPLPEGARTRVAALEPPSVPANILAVRLDLAEKADLNEPASPTPIPLAAGSSLEPASQPSSIAVRVYGYEITAGSADRPKVRIVHANYGYAAVSARDVFNRSFGVLSVAAN